MENLKDIEGIYKKALINKLKHPEEWMPFKDMWLTNESYVRTFCFSEEGKVYFKVSISKYDNKTIYINEDKTYGNDVLSVSRYSFKLTFFDFKIKKLIKKLSYYLKQKKELEEIEILKDFLPKEIVRSFKINKIKNHGSI